MDTSIVNSMFKEAVKIQILENWKSYLVDNYQRIAETLSHAVINVGDEVSLLMVIDPKDLTIHEIGLMVGDAKPSMYSSSEVWFLQIPIFDAAHPETLKDIEMLVDFVLQAQIDSDCKTCTEKKSL